MFSPKFLAQQGMQQVSESFYSQDMSRNDIPLKKTMFHSFWGVSLHVYFFSYIISIHAYLAWLCEQLTAANGWRWGTQISGLIGSKNLG